MTFAPDSFGSFAGDLLVGNFGDGTINAFDPKNFQFEGKLTGADGNPLTITDLWQIIPGNGGSGGDANAIFFTAGLENEAHGLFGSLAPDATANPMAASSGHSPLG